MSAPSPTGPSRGAPNSPFAPPPGAPQPQPASVSLATTTASRLASRVPGGAEYQRVQAIAGWAWWRPVWSVALVVLLFVASVGTVSLVVLLIDTVVPIPGSMGDESENSPVAVLYLDLVLASLILVAAGALRFAFGTPWSAVSSVLMRFRFSWFARCLVSILPVYAVSIGLSFALDGELVWRPEPHYLWLFAFALLLTPLQAAGEEYVFRGWVMQVVGSIIALRWLSLAVSSVISAVLFALAHGSWDLQTMLILGSMSVVAVVLTWRTGGLEAATAIHAANNVVLLLFATSAGALSEVSIDRGTQVPWEAVAVDAVTLTVATVIIWVQSRSVARTTPVAS